MAFPDTPILDDFNRANESPLGRWWSASPVYNTVGLARVVSNQCQAVSGDAHPAWALSYPPNQQCYVTIANWPASSYLQVACRGTRWNSAGFNNDYYSVRATQSSNAFALFKTVNDSDTQLATTTLAMAAGDAIGISTVDTTIQAYHKPAAGAWTLIHEVTDSALSGGGQIGVLFLNATLDDFGGGAIPIAAGTPTDITGKGRAPFRSAWSMLQDGGGYKSGGAFLSKGVFYADQDTADSDMLLDYFLAEAGGSPPVVKRDGMFFGAV